MLNLEELTGKPATETVVLRGQSVAVRAMTASEQGECEAAFERPRPPKVKNPNAGSLAAPIDDTADPAFVAAFSIYDTRVRAAWAAVGLCVSVPTLGVLADQKPEGRKKWIEAAADLVLRTLSGGELDGVLRVMGRLGALGDMVEVAAKK